VIKKTTECRKSHSTGSEAHAALSLFWISKCLNEHQLCRPWRPRSYPTRVIHIDRSSHVLRLCEGAELPPNERYTTVSHCWGQLTNRVVLTQANLNSWKQRLPSLEPMRTFIDAIDFTRKLGVSYIWIDSLCIIQDSAADWLTESARMPEVYLNSFVNLTAAMALDDTVGCYADRDPEIALPMRLLFVGEVGVSGDSDTHIIAPRQPGDHKRLEGEFWLEESTQRHRDVFNAPVCRRCWIVQEVSVSILQETSGFLIPSLSAFSRLEYSISPNPSSTSNATKCKTPNSVRTPSD
jgi:Heterokaryon incompatibility protein (HET)